MGAGTLAADGSRQPSDAELDVATHQGKLIAGYAITFKRGKLFRSDPIAKDTKDDTKLQRMMSK